MCNTHGVLQIYSKQQYFTKLYYYRIQQRFLTDMTFESSNNTNTNSTKEKYSVSVIRNVQNSSVKQRHIF